MSVVLGKEVLAAGRDASSIVAGFEGFGLVSFPAELARSKGQGVIRKPLEDEPAHAEVFGRKTRSVQRALAKGANWVYSPSPQ